METRNIETVCASKKIIFQYPPFRGTYTEAVSDLDKEGLERPSSAETASLVHEIFKDSNGKYFLPMLRFLRENVVWEITGNLYLPKSTHEEVHNGIILDLDSQNLKFENGKLKMDKDSLVQRLRKDDPLVKFVPFGFSTGSQKWQELAKNKYVQARYGEEGAEKIAEVASYYESNHGKQPRLIMSFFDEEKTWMSALADGRILSSGLTIYSNWGVPSDGYIFGRFWENKK